MKEITKTELIELAKELNTVLGLDPQLPITANKEILLEETKQAMQLVAPEDDFSDPVRAILKRLTA